MSSAKSESHDKSKQELAEDRTDWAQERTLLAKERTFSAWGRTGLATLAVGLAIARLLSSVESKWLALTIGALLIFTSTLIFILGFLSYRKALKELAEQGIRGTPIWIIRLITIVLVICAILAMVMIFQE